MELWVVRRLILIIKHKAKPSFWCQMFTQAKLRTSGQESAIRMDRGTKKTGGPRAVGKDIRVMAYLPESLLRGSRQGLSLL